MKYQTNLPRGRAQEYIVREYIHTSSIDRLTCFKQLYAESSPFVTKERHTGASIPVGEGGTYPPIFMKGDVHGNVPKYFRSDVVLLV